MIPKMFFLILLVVALVIGVLYLVEQEKGTSMKNMLDRFELASQIENEKNKDKKVQLMKRLRTVMPTK